MRQLKTGHISAILLFALMASFTGLAPAAETQATEAPASVLIENVRIWDGTANDLTGNMHVLVEGNLITRLSSGKIQAPPSAQVIDGANRVLMPGLIDMHQHLAITTAMPDMRNNTDWMYNGALAGAQAHKMLLRGFTTVRDIGGPTIGLARAIDEGRIPGPRIYSSGAFISQTSGHGDSRNYNDPHPNMTGELHIMDRLGWGYLADGPDEVTRAVREVLRSGATQLKLMAGGGVASFFDPIETVQYTPEELRAAVIAAANYDTYVAVHAYTDAAIRQALEAGVMSIDHGMLIEEDTLKMMAEKGAFLSPQVYIFSGGLDLDWFTDENRRKLAQVSAGLDKEMQLAKKHNVKIVFGTDMFEDPLWAKQNLELGMRLKWFSSVEVLRQATSTAAELLGLCNTRNPYKDGPLGVIQEGAYADLLIVDGDPVSDVKVLEDPAGNMKLIMKDGVIYKNTLGD